MSFATLPATVYLLCMIASVVGAGLLVRTYLRTRSKLLLWTAVSFAFLALNNFFLVLDMLVFRTLDLWPWRALSFQAAVLILLYGLIWETD